VKAGDWITFKIPTSGGKKLVARALRVRHFDTFEAMLRECGVDACLPGLKGGLQEGIRTYRSFGTFSGATYAELESESGAIAIDVAPLRPKVQ
jgi:ASC-1-like (ASCH) protein